MDRAWLDRLIDDAELVADALLRLANTTQSSLLDAISSARRATGAEACEAAYRSLQTVLPEALRKIEPVTLFDLRQSWVQQKGFQPSTVQLCFFWPLTLILLFMVAYATTLYNRASEISETLTSFKDVRLAEQGVRLFNMARLHQDAIVKSQSGKDQTLAADAFFRALTDLQTTQNRVSAVTAAANEINAELQIVAKTGYALCQLKQWVVSLGGGSHSCIAPNLAAAAAAGAKPATNGYSSVPPLDLSVGDAKKPQVSMPELVAFFDSADLFFQDIGAGLVQTRQNLLMFDYLQRDIKTLLDALRAWIVPAAYGMLGAALFFSRRFLDPRLPSPGLLRAIYRILLGGFAGIVFAWLWSPTTSVGTPGSSGSLSGFGIAFLAGYATDIFFHLLDGLVQATIERLQSKQPAEAK